MKCSWSEICSTRHGRTRARTYLSYFRHQKFVRVRAWNLRNPKLGYFLSWSCPINSGKKSRQIFIFAHALPLIKFGNLLWFFLQCILVIGFFWYFGTFLDEFLGLLRIIECNEPILLSFHENSLWWVINLNLMLWDFRSRKKSLDLNFMLLIDDVENVSNTFFHGMTHKVWLIFKLNTAGDNGKLDLITVGYLPAMGLCQM